MHSLVRRYIKTAIWFLFAGLLIGIWMIVRREFWYRAAPPYEVSAHTHAIFVGFVMMMILGVALWLFPRPEKNDRRYRPQFIAIAYWLLTAGTAVRVIAELLRLDSNALWLRATVVLSGVAQAVGLALYFHAMWFRIRALGSRAREASGERF